MKILWGERTLNKPDLKGLNNKMRKCYLFYSMKDIQECFSKKLSLTYWKEWYKKYVVPRDLGVPGRFQQWR